MKFKSEFRAELRRPYDPHHTQWWSVPDEHRRRAYYLCLRVHYGMLADEALRHVREAWGKYPEFMSDPIGELKRAVDEGHKRRMEAA
jgi:hypothetical protein